MNLQLIALLKSEMEYTEERRACKGCEHYTEKENLHVDRMWDSLCTLLPLGSIEVKPEGVCRFWRHIEK